MSLHAQSVMKTTFKDISEQVMVITGASSGIGLAAPETAAAAGARVVLAARSESELNRIGDLSKIGRARPFTAAGPVRASLAGVRR